MTKEYDSYKTSSGLIDDYVGTVVESWFGINAQYNPDLHLLMWKIEVEDAPASLEDGMVTEQFTIGPNWESLDGGETVEYPGDPMKNFNAATQYGKIIRRAVDEWDLKETLQERGDTTQASIWNGLTFHFESEVLTKRFKGRDGEWVEPRPKVMPRTFIGGAGAGAGAAAGSGSGSGRTSFDPTEILELEPEQWAELTELAQGSANHGSFVDGAMKLQWVEGDGKVVMALADSRVYQALH